MEPCFLVIEGSQILQTAVIRQAILPLGAQKPASTTSVLERLLRTAGSRTIAKELRDSEARYHVHPSTSVQREF